MQSQHIYLHWLRFKYCLMIILVCRKKTKKQQKSKNILFYDQIKY